MGDNKYSDSITKLRCSLCMSGQLVVVVADYLINHSFILEPVSKMFCVIWNIYGPLIFFLFGSKN
ncbi:hypothetical protein DERP_009260, partial [Dermatophagoides pteronyssinus]